MSVYNEYSKLNEVILGISQKIFMQDELPANHANTHGAFRCVTCPLSRSVGFSVTQPNLW